MTSTKKAITEQLAAAGMAIHNTQANGRLGELMAAFGYDTAKLQQGDDLLQKARTAMEVQSCAQSAWQTATMTLATAEGEAHDTYQALSQVVRAAFGLGHPALGGAGIDHPMPRRQKVFLGMATLLFNNVMATADLAAAVAQFGYTTQKLTDERAKIMAMTAALEARESAKGLAQQATVNQAAALLALDRWLRAFRRVAKVALRGEDQLMEQAGILARSGRTEAQRQAPAKAAATRKLHHEGLKVLAQKEDNSTAVA